jgi:asparagine synthase (glutamine-hydrolysing)
MSGIVGIVQFDGSPVEAELLRKLTGSLIFRGPDAQQTWFKDNVGFAHTLFKTTEESERDSQPLTLDGKTWIVADARIDAREELFAALKAAGEIDIVPSPWTDAELILRSYQAWGLHCVEHLLGDFAFGIWDESKKRLFCARDHMGVKPFYYAQLGACVIFSNTLDCIRRDPRISDKLNDLAIADFLFFGFNQEPATTSFAEIRRIPPAHYAIWSRGGFSIRRYWSLPIEEPIFYKQDDDYVAHFHDLLCKSVADRLRNNRVWIFMSGGIDSPTLAATARDLLRQRCANFELGALTQVDSFVPEERRYAQTVANHLAIPIKYQPWTDASKFDWENTTFSVPEPHPNECLVPAERQFWDQFGPCSRVFLYGEGPDNALIMDSKPYLSYLLKCGSYRRLLGTILMTLLSDRRPPFSGRILQAIKNSGNADGTGKSDYPEWLNSAFEYRLQLRERWHALNFPDGPRHTIRPKGYASLQSPRWQAMFEGFDPGVTKTSYEVRHPFVDVRMLQFLLAVPPLPWCRSKYLLRKSMAGRLPQSVLRRRKKSVDMRPVRKFIASLCAAPFRPTEEIRAFVDLERLSNSRISDNIESILRLRSLNHWLQNSYRSSDNHVERVPCERFARKATAIG